jgi:hypothetical protein
VKSVKFVSIAGLVGTVIPDEDYQFQTEEIRFRSSRCESDAMIRFLRCFPRLRVLAYEHSGETIKRSEFNAAKFGIAIAHLKPYLEELSLRNDDYDQAIPGQISELFGSLAAFHVLTTLVIDADALLGPHHGNSERRLSDLSPSSLETLRLTQCLNSIVFQL